MATKTSQYSALWDNQYAWSPQGKPGIGDDVIVQAGHKMSPPAAGVVEFQTCALNGELEVNTNVAVGNGGHILIGASGQLYRSAGTAVQRRMYCPTAGGRYRIRMARTFPDTRQIDLPAYRFDGIMPTISAEGSGGNYAEMGTLVFNSDDQSDYYLGEQGLPNLGAQLEEKEHEGVGVNYTRWRKGAVRNMRCVVKWPKEAPGGSDPYPLDYYEVLRRMTLSPYGVLVTTPWIMFRGQIETMVSGMVAGGRHHAATIMIVEGRDG